MRKSNFGIIFYLFLGVIFASGCKKENVLKHSESFFSVDRVISIPVNYLLLQEGHGFGVFQLDHSFEKEKAILIDDFIFFTTTDLNYYSRLFSYDILNEKLSLLIDSMPGADDGGYKINHLENSNYYVLQSANIGSEYFLMKKDELIYQGNAPVNGSNKSIYFNDFSNLIYYYYAFPNSTNANLKFATYDYINNILVNIATVPPGPGTSDFSEIFVVANSNIILIHHFYEGVLHCYDANMNLIWTKFQSEFEKYSAFKLDDNFIYIGRDNYHAGDTEFYTSTIEKINLNDGSLVATLEIPFSSSIWINSLNFIDNSNQIIFTGVSSEYVYLEQLYNTKLVIGNCDNDLQSVINTSIFESGNYFRAINTIKTQDGGFLIYGLNKKQSSDFMEPTFIKIVPHE